MDSVIVLCPSHTAAPTIAPSAQGEAIQHRAQSDNPFPRPAGNAEPDAPQDMVSILGC